MNEHEFHEYVKSEGKFAKVTCSESRKPVADNLWRRNNA